AWPGGERAGAPPHGDAPPPPLAARLLTEQQTSSAIATGERAVVATAPDAAASGALVVTVSLHDGQPAIGVGVDVLPQNGRAVDLQACHAVTAAGGGARFHAVPAGT